LSVRGTECPPRRHCAGVDTKLTAVRTMKLGVRALAFWLVAGPASAASMQKVNQSDWWSGATGLPSYVNMYTYVPDQLAAKPPIVVGPHHCQGTAQSTYSEMASLVSIADKTGFILIFPEATGENCWDAGSTRSLKHGGGGDTGAIVQMVKYTLSKYSGDASRVYTVGGSSGGIMTEALLGVYPDVFMAGVSLMGVPCGCWADGYNDTTGTGSTAQWSGNCAGGSVTKTGQAWGDLVRSYFPGYTGHRPRLQHWHGTADTTLNYKNLAEDVKEWTNLLGLSETPDATDTPKSGTSHQLWKNACGYTVYETFALSGVGHAVPFDGNAVAAYFGLDVARTTDPETAACGAGMGGAAGAGGMTAAGGAAAGGRTGVGGAGGVPGTGGVVADGGTAGSQGMTASSGGAHSGGSGGVSAVGGSGTGSAMGGTGAAGGTGGTGDANQAGRSAVTGGASTAGGQGGTGVSLASGGNAPHAGTSGGTEASRSPASSTGCGCVVGGGTSERRPLAAALVLGAVVFARRRRAAERRSSAGRA